MIRNHFLLALRLFWRNKVFSFIHVFGLAIALAFCILIFLFVQDDLSFDRFHANADRIYRLHKTRLIDPAYPADEKRGFFSSFKQVQWNKMIHLPVPLADALKNQVPQINYAVRTAEDQRLVSNGRQTFQESVLWTDPDFLQMFSFPFVQGNLRNALQPNSVVISERMAKKYFGTANPIGQTLTFKRLDEPVEVYQVTGVVADVPANSSLQFDIAAPFMQSYYYKTGKDQPRNFYAVNTYLQLHENASLMALQKNLGDFTRRYWSEEIAQHRKENKMASTAAVYELGVTPLKDWHFDTSVPFAKVTNPLYAYILIGLAILILLIACINYISLALANAAARLREINVRKVVGASRRQLAVQLYLEAQLLVVLALGLALLLATIFLPAFNQFTDKTLILSLSQQPSLLVITLTLALLVGLVAGGYPAWVLSGFQISGLLKGSKTYRFSPAFSNALVLVQYSFCVFLITCAIVMHRQMNYITGKDLGYAKEQVLVLNNYATGNQKTVTTLQRFKSIAAQNPAIAGVSGSSFSFGKNEGFYQFYFTINKENTAVFVYNADADYLKTMGITLAAGQNFSETHPDDSHIIVNETLANMLGGADKILNQMLKELNTNFGAIKVIGVARDFHFGTLQDKMVPVMFSADLTQMGKILIKVKPGKIPETVAFARETWKQLAPDQPFDYSFVDEDVAFQYKTYQQWTGIIGTATIFAVCMACLGLFGLSGLNAANRTKEIGIRKVLGASVPQIFVLLNRRTASLVLVSLVVAFPTAHYLMSRWLNDFAYRISIDWQVFVWSGLAGMLASLVAVGFYSVKAAVANPVKSLRSE